MPCYVRDPKMFTGRLNSAGPGAGLGFELDAIAAAFIGGAAVTGGVGTVVGAVLAASSSVC